MSFINVVSLSVSFGDLGFEFLYPTWCFYILHLYNSDLSNNLASRDITKLECIELGSLFMLEMGDINIKDYSGF